jgi:hypothetical protein
MDNIYKPNIKITPDENSRRITDETQKSPTPQPNGNYKLVSYSIRVAEVHRFFNNNGVMQGTPVHTNVYEQHIQPTDFDMKALVSVVNKTPKALRAQKQQDAQDQARIATRSIPDYTTSNEVRHVIHSVHNDLVTRIEESRRTTLTSLTHDILDMRDALSKQICDLTNEIKSKQADPLAEQIKLAASKPMNENNILFLFKSNCFNYNGNYEITFAQAVQIVRKIEENIFKQLKGE